METKHREHYETPSTMVLEVKIESGILTVSNQEVQGTRTTYGAAVDDTWE